MRKLFLILFSLFISVSLFTQEPLASAQKRRIIDDAGLLTAADIAGFEKRAEDIANLYNFDLVIVTKPSLSGASIEAYADDFFDYNGYGFGDEGDGCLFLQVIDQREYQFSTAGRGIRLLDENARAFDKIENEMIKYLKVDNYAGAYHVYFNLWDEFLSLNAKGRSYNFFHQYLIQSIIAAWIFAMLCGFFCLNYWKTQMNAIIPAKDADNYMSSKGLAVSQKKDRFLFSTVSKTKRESNSSSGGGSIRTAASGRIHGGRGGRY